MKRSKFISAVVIASFLFIRIVPAGMALADRDATPSPTPTPSASVSPSPTPTPSDSPAPKKTDGDSSPSPTPSPSASPTPTPSSSPSPSASDSKSPADTSNRGSSQTGASNTGPGGCTGTVPTWVFASSTNKWAQADQGSFTCDAATGLWLSPEYYYNKQDGWYEIEPSGVTPPSYMVTAPNVVHTAVGDLVVGSNDYNVAKSLGLLDPSEGFVTNSTGPSGQVSQTSTGSANQSWFDLTSLVNIINALGSGAQSGNVTASANTAVGNAVTGAASVIANLVNLLASAWSWSNGDLAFFMQNILGNQTGDITLSPTQTSTGAGGNLGQGNSNNSLNVNAKNSGSITNNVALNAGSGNANVSDNTAAGNVATGNASAEVNIVNLINSYISSGSSFFGILNIFGSLNGDVLFPNGFLNGLVPSGTGGSSSAGVGTTGPGSSNSVNAANSNNANVQNTTNNAVANNVTTTAKSGAVDASSDTAAGNAQSGTATTTQGLFNIANSSIFGDNAVLVIVNVLGHWIGKIMTLPGGSSESALLTGNASVSANGTGPNSTNSTNSTNSNKANVNQESDGTITNNVNVNAASGDATADQNTKVGNVTSGNASATSSVANIFNTVLNVKHWFGVLIINVFGNWTGDVGDNSAAGNSTSTSPSVGTSHSAGSVVAPLVPANYSTLPSVTAPVDSSVSGTGTPTGGSTGSISGGGSAIGPRSNVETASTSKPVVLADSNTGSHNTDDLLVISSAVLFIAAGIAAWERKIKHR